jgi:hypothetical protein
LGGQDWAIMREIVDAVKTAVPDAANRPAGQVLLQRPGLRQMPLASLSSIGDVPF